jgi:hypothetical protein
VTGLVDCQFGDEMFKTYESRRELLKCFCVRHNIGTYIPNDDRRLDKIKYDAHIKCERDDAHRRITSEPTLVGPLGSIQVTCEGVIQVCIKSRYLWKKYSLPRVKLREVIKPGLKRESRPRHYYFLEGGSKKRELKAVQDIGLQPLSINARDIREKWEKEDADRLRASVAPHKDVF